jgi:NADPH-dependent curcumin reductase
MPSIESRNRRVVLARRPSGTPTLSDFRIEESDVPSPGPGEVLLRTLHLSLDPYMRAMMNELAPVYSRSLAIGEVMAGGTVSRVEASNNAQFRQGELVLGNAGWQDYAVSDGKDLTPADAAHPSLSLGLFGMPAFTAYVGLLEIGAPRSGETVVVAAATGAVGSVVGQIAKLKGARVVGIAGGALKCRHAVEELGFDDCIDHRDPEFAQRLSAACPQGIDVYFENVGRKVLEAVLPLVNIGARIPLIGFIAHYNETKGATSAGANTLSLLLLTLLQKRVRMEGMIILDHYATRHEEFLRDMRGWVASGQVAQREHIVEGLENSPAAFIGLLEGKNFGKLVVKVAS